MLQFSMKIDWLTLSKKMVSPEPSVDLTREHLARILIYEASNIGIDTSEVRTINGSGFYDIHLLFPLSGIRASISFELEKQGLVIIASGNALPAGTLAQRMLASAVDNDWKPTRLDLALDIFNSDVTVEDWYWQYHKAHYDKTQRKMQYIRSAKGDTLNIGSRESDKYARIYDKAKEQGLGNDWVRFEIEFKGWACVQIVPKVLADLRTAAMLHVAMVSLPMFWLAQYIESYAMGEGVVFEPKMRTKDGREKWLRDVVAKLLARMKAGDREGFDDLMNYIDEMSQGYETELL